MDYEITNPVSMIADGKHKGKIYKATVWNNPSGADKLIVEFEREGDLPFSHFFTPGFESFGDLIRIAGAEPKAKGSFDHDKLIGKEVEFETKITTASNGNDYCNVLSVKEVGASEAKEETPDFPKV